MGYRDASPDGRKDREGRPLLVLPQGTSLAGKYQVSYLGVGGMSIVYKGYRGGKTYFIKEVDSHVSQLVISLSQEKFMLERLEHPGIVKIHDFFEQEGFCYLVTDYIEGKSLNKLISPLPDVFIQEKIVLDWARQLYDIFEYLHSQHPPIIYRDLKPQNVIRDKEGKIHLVDFGIARVYKENSIGDTSPMGSYLTASPEHYGGKQTDERSDIYTLGATFHYLLSNGKGRSGDPFEFSPLRKINNRITEKTEKVIMQSLSIDPAKRFSSVGEMRKAHLDSVNPEAVRATPVIADNSETVSLSARGRPVMEGASARTQKTGYGESENIFRSFIAYALSQPKLISIFLALLVIVSVAAVVLRGAGASRVVTYSSPAATSAESTVSLDTGSSPEPSESPSSTPLVPEPGFNIVIGSSSPVVKPTRTLVIASPTAPHITGQTSYPSKVPAPPMTRTRSPATIIPQPTVTASVQVVKKEDMLAQIFHYKKESIMPAPPTYSNSHGDYFVSVPTGYLQISNEENNVIFANIDERIGTSSLRVIIIKTFKLPTDLATTDQAIGTIKISMMNGGATILDEGPVNRQGALGTSYTGYYLSYRWYAPAPLGTKVREDFIFKDYYMPHQKVEKVFAFKASAPEGIFSTYDSSEFQYFLDSIKLRDR